MSSWDEYLLQPVVLVAGLMIAFLIVSFMVKGVKKRP